MNKRVILCAAFTMVLAGGVFAQHQWVSGEVYGAGGGARYEYVVMRNFSVGAYVSYNYLPFSAIWQETNELGFGATGRYYPLARKFFLELSLGFNSFDTRVESEYGGYYDYRYNDYGDYYEYSYYERRFNGFCVAPGVGWTIDVGRPGGLFISAGAKVPFTFGSSKVTLLLGNGVGFNVTPYVGLGCAF